MSNEKIPSPELFLQTVNGYRDSAAIKGAVELELFTHISEGANTVEQIVSKCKATARGIRILCDHLSVLGFLSKSAGLYSLTIDSDTFLNKNSPAYMGDIVYFLLDPFFVRDIGDVAEIVRNGTIEASTGSNEPEHPMWVTFARAMSGLQGYPAAFIADMIELDSDKSIRVLDIAAGSGLFGIRLAEKYKNVTVTAVDWPQVLQVATENAQAAGINDRYIQLPGSAFDVDFDQMYDVILLTNFLHHFNEETCVTFLRKLKESLKVGGKVYTLEFVPDEDRLSPPFAALFSMQMLRQTESGDAYTASELTDMCTQANLKVDALVPIPGTPSTVVVATHS